MDQWLHFHEVILMKKWYQPLVQKSKIYIFKTTKEIIINLFKVNNKWTWNCKTRSDNFQNVNIEQTLCKVITAAVCFEYAEYNLIRFKLYC